MVLYTGSTIDLATSGNAHIFYHRDGNYLSEFHLTSDGFIGTIAQVMNVSNSSDLAPLVDPGIMFLAHHVHLTGGDPLMALAWENSDATDASAFATDLEIAHDYRTSTTPRSSTR
jgi:hypothetical protein